EDVIAFVNTHRDFDIELGKIYCRAPLSLANELSLDELYVCAALATDDEISIRDLRDYAVSHGVSKANTHAIVFTRGLVCRESGERRTRRYSLLAEGVVRTAIARQIQEAIEEAIASDGMDQPENLFECVNQ